MQLQDGHHGRVSRDPSFNMYSTLSRSLCLVALAPSLLTLILVPSLHPCIEAKSAFCL